MKGLIFTLGLTYGGALVSLFSPFVGLLIYICFAILRPEHMWHWSVPAGNYSRIVAIGLLLGWAFHGFGNWKFGRAGFIVYSFIAFFLWSVLSGLQSNNPAVAWQFIEMLAKILLPFLVGITLVDTVDRLKQLAWVIVLSQGYVAFELNLAYLSGGGDFLVYFRENGFGSMDNNCVSIGMAAGTGFAFFLGIGSSKWWQKLLAFGCTLLMAHTILFSFSRGGMIAMGIVGILAFWLLPKRPIHYLVFAVLLVIAIRLAGPEVQERFATAFASEDSLDASARSRLELWNDCIDVMSKNPVFGIGPDHWPLIAQEYGWPPGKEAHTLWLQFGAELGLVGLLIILCYYGSCTARLWRISWARIAVADPWFHCAGAMVVTGLIGFMVSAQFVSLKFLELPYYIALFGAGVLKLNSVPAPHADEEPEEVTESFEELAATCA